MVVIHPAVEAPSLKSRHDLSNPSACHIDFHHPAYPAAEGRLLRLSAPDCPEGGLHHGLALDALTIIAANASGGFLSETRDGPPINVPRHAVLLGTDYFFIVPNPRPVDPPSNEPYRYPICPSFGDWQFPHKNLPRDWYVGTSDRTLAARKPVSGFTNNVIARDETCRVSGYHSAIQACHLVPRSESDWFFRNCMGEYNQEDMMRGDYALDDSSNAITLRADLHIEFDRLGFVLAPKSDDGYAVHCLIGTPDILPAFHNRLARPLSDVAPEFLYARFAYAIFPRLSAFLTCGRSSKLVVRVKGDCTSADPEVVDVPPQEFRQPPPKSRSVSPKKRMRSEADISTPMENLLRANGESPRGRKRRRSTLSTPPLTRSKSPGLSPDDRGDCGPTPHLFKDILTTTDHDTGIHPNNDSGDCTSVDEPPSNIPDHIWHSTTQYPGQKRMRRLKEYWIEQQRPAGWERPRRWNGNPDDLEGWFNVLPGDDRSGDFEGEDLPVGEWEQCETHIVPEDRSAVEYAREIVDMAGRRSSTAQLNH